jgi:type 1 glutamine amidotransferase
MSIAGRIATIVLTVLLIGVPAAWAAPKPANPEEVKKVTEAMPAAAPARPAKAHKVLVFCRCEGFPHGSIPLANACFEAMGKATGAFETVLSDEMSAFDPENLKQFDAILFNNTTRLAFKDAGQRKALLDFVQAGKGIIGVHAATDNFYDFPEAAEMMGGVFSGHPWNAGGTWAVKLDEPGHPLNAAFGGKGFKIRDEIYKYRAGSSSRQKVRVLASLDFSDAATAKPRNPKHADEADVGISWVRRFGDGRVFYCSLGHNNEVFWNKAVLAHYLAGIQYALGDLNVPDAPVSAGPGQAAGATVPDPCPPVEKVPSVPWKADLADATPYPLIGDWEGTINNTEHAVGQVIALGQGQYQLVLAEEFDAVNENPVTLSGTGAKGAPEVNLNAKVDKGHFAGTQWAATLTAGSLVGKVEGATQTTFALKRVARLSPTLGARAPAGAVVLLGAGTKDLNAEWMRHGGKPCGWKLLPGGAMQVVPGAGSIITKKQFGHQRLHVEFRTPLEPEKRGQGRGNSGVYLQGLFEVQVLDSYGLAPKNNECGGIYGVAAPRVNMCAPPGQWQTYDIAFQAAVLKDGKVAAPARITVLHNGVKVHDSVALPHTTTAAPGGAIAQTGGLYLQDHGNAVEYRNIWIVEPPAATPGKE